MRDYEINATYDDLKYQFILEIGTVWLLELVDNIQSIPNYMTIDESQSTIDWDDIKKSKLIESLIMNLPVPPIVLYYTSYEQYKVIDGKQRLKVIVDFFSDKFALNGLDVLTDLNGFTFATLPYRVKDILNHRSLGLQYMIFGWDASPEEVEKFIGIVAERLGHC